MRRFVLNLARLYCIIVTVLPLAIVYYKVKSLCFCTHIIDNSGVDLSNDTGKVSIAHPGVVKADEVYFFPLLSGTRTFTSCNTLEAATATGICNTCLFQSSEYLWMRR